MKIEGRVAFAKAWISTTFGRFSKNFFDFLASRKEFWVQVTNYKNVQNTILYKKDYWCNFLRCILKKVVFQAIF